MTVLHLNARERMALDGIIASATDTRLLKRAYALKRLAQGEWLPEVADDLGVSRQSVYNWVERWVERTDQRFEQRLADAARPGRPATVMGVIDPLIDAMIDANPRDFGYNATTWTAPLLVDYLSDRHDLVVSTQSVRLALERLDIRWKRPRHSLALRPVHWRQAKGG